MDRHCVKSSNMSNTPTHPCNAGATSQRWVEEFVEVLDVVIDSKWQSISFLYFATHVFI
jgi:hypothetical protein